MFFARMFLYNAMKYVYGTLCAIILHGHLPTIILEGLMFGGKAL
jgi:hypothetical protein